MGYQPLDVIDVRLVVEIFAASAAIDGRGDDPFTSLKGELDDGEYNAFVKKVRERWTDVLDGRDPEEARRVLVSIVERAIGELTAKAARIRTKCGARRGPPGRYPGIRRQPDRPAAQEIRGELPPHRAPQSQ